MRQPGRVVCRLHHQESSVLVLIDRSICMRRWSRVRRRDRVRSRVRVEYGVEVEYTLRPPTSPSKASTLVHLYTVTCTHVHMYRRCTLTPADYPSFSLLLPPAHVKCPKKHWSTRRPVLTSRFTSLYLISSFPHTSTTYLSSPLVSFQISPFPQSPSSRSVRTPRPADLTLPTAYSTRTYRVHY